MADLQAFDAAFGLPNPPSFTVVTMPGTPAFDPTDGNMVGWAEETSLDVQWSHAMAPGAKIVLVAAKSNSDDDLIAGLNYAIDHHLGDVVSMSFGESGSVPYRRGRSACHPRLGEGVQPCRESASRSSFPRATRNATTTADAGGDVFPFPNVSYPASSPQVTGVGGTSLFFGVGNHADPNPEEVSGETVWNDEQFGIAAAGGGGVSALFSQPLYQASLPSSVQKTLHTSIVVFLTSRTRATAA